MIATRVKAQGLRKKRERNLYIMLKIYLHK